MGCFKMVFCVKKNPEMSDEEFYDYWENGHGTLVKSWAETMGAKRYVQSYTLNTFANAYNQKTRGTKEPYDGIAEIWWDSEEDFYKVAKAASTTDMNEVLLKDEKVFIDMENSSLFFTTENEIFNFTK